MPDERRPAETLLPMSAMDDFRISKGDADPRGWKVVAGDGTRVGKVDDLLVAPTTGKVRYLDCRLDAKVLGLEDRNRHVLLPADAVGLNPHDKLVIASGIQRDDVLRLTPYQGLTLSRDMEESISATFGSRWRGLDAAAGAEGLAGGEDATPAGPEEPLRAGEHGDASPGVADEARPASGPARPWGMD